MVTVLRGYDKSSLVRCNLFMIHGYLLNMLILFNVNPRFLMVVRDRNFMNKL